MTAFPIACTGLGLLAAVGCVAPAPVAIIDRGQRIDHAVLEGFKQGLTTRAEVLALLGKPSTTAVNPEDGSLTCSWDYFHSDGAGSVAIMTILKFGRDDTLQIKMVSQSSQLH
jgi:outer membrane protein assembly factor BamE (lipoprotein component of BamABCDE complex)